MDVTHARAGEDLFGLRHHPVLADHDPGAVDDAVVFAISLDQIVGGTGKDLGHLRAFVPGAGVGTEEDRPGLCIGLCCGKGAMREDQHFGPLRDIGQAMATWVAAAVRGGAFRQLAMGVGLAGLIGAHGFGGHGDDLGHGFGPIGELCAYG